MSAPLEDLETVIHNLKDILSPSGFESYPFKVGQYNECVDAVFKLNYHPETLAFVIISTPHMFEKAFKEFITRQECVGVRDPIDECVAYHFDKIKQFFPGQVITAIHDFELTPTRRPKVLVQTAGHVAGAAYYYQRKDVSNDPWPKDRKIYGVSIHPKFGGWFALRGVLIFEDIRASDLQSKPPLDVIDTDEKKIVLLEKFNNSWQDWTYRDLVEPIARYSADQKEYFATLPKNRSKLLKSYMENNLEC